MVDKERLDLLLTERGLTKSREKAQREIMAGNVYVSGQLKDKSGKKFPKDADISLKRDKERYVSRGGRKLDHALQEFDLDVEGCKVVDIGASTGGFTDCLLDNGAEEIWAIDVGKGQLDWGLRQDERVQPIEGKNARYLQPEEIGNPVDLVTIDVSFISLKLILPRAKDLLTEDGKIICLVKPQFEAGPDRVENGGVVTDPEIHRDILVEIAGFAEKEGMTVTDCTYSPIRGKSSKNIEYFLYLTGSGSSLKTKELVNVVEAAHGYFD